MKQSNSNADSLLNEVRRQRLKYAQNILKNKFIQHQGFKMRFQYFIHGQKPNDGYRLVFGFHGGGNCPFDLNQQQWNNHKHLYDQSLPQGTIWFVPRSPQEASDMWWKSYIPQFITLITQCFSIMDMIDTNRVFITGYSAGGDGIYHLASMMADVLSGAAMMAGHPNRAEVYNLRNLAFSVQVGQNDHAYDRANWCKVYIDKINQFSKQYGGFQQYSLLHKNTPHWMGKKDASIFPSLLNQVRQPYPEFILFKQHPRTFKKTFYYLKVQQKHAGVISVRRKDNKFEIQSQDKIPITVMINSYFVDFNKQVQVYHNGDLTIKRRPQKSQRVIRQTIEQFVDPWYIFQDQLISIPLKRSKDFSINRPFEKENLKSCSQRIKKMQEQIQQDQNLHVSFKLKANEQKGGQVYEKGGYEQNKKKFPSQNNQIHQDRGEHHESSFSRKLKRLQQTCQRKCQIY